VMSSVTTAMTSGQCDERDAAQTFREVEADR
jgi:hypothetical protein